MEYMYIRREGDTLKITEFAKVLEARKNEYFVEDYNIQSKCGITGVHEQALYLMAMGHEFFKRFGKSPIYMENNVLGMKERIKLSGSTFEYVDEQVDKSLITKSAGPVSKKVVKPLVSKTPEIFPKSDFNEPLNIEGTKTAPKISCDAIQGIIEIKGRWTLNMVSSPNVEESFKPLSDWLDKYATNPSKQTNVTIQFEYLSTSCSINMLMIFKKLEVICKRNNPIVIFWHYKEGDGDMLEAGEDFESIVRVPFKMVSFKD